MDTPRTILILGGYGNTGLPLVAQILRETEARARLSYAVPSGRYDLGRSASKAASGSA